jgi:hypothetical protein
MTIVFSRAFSALIVILASWAGIVLVDIVLRFR